MSLPDLEYLVTVTTEDGSKFKRFTGWGDAYRCAERAARHGEEAEIWQHERVVEADTGGFQHIGAAAQAVVESVVQKRQKGAA